MDPVRHGSVLTSKGGADEREEEPVTTCTTRPGAKCRRCRQRHCSWRRVAQCRWPRACWIAGEPPITGPCFALLAHCNVLTVTLLANRAEAEESKTGIDRLACGSRCRRNHQIIRLG